MKRLIFSQSTSFVQTQGTSCRFYILGGFHLTIMYGSLYVIKSWTSPQMKLICMISLLLLIIFCKQNVAIVRCNAYCTKFFMEYMFSTHHCFVILHACFKSPLHFVLFQFTFPKRHNIRTMWMFDMTVKLNICFLIALSSLVWQCVPKFPRSIIH